MTRSTAHDAGFAHRFALCANLTHAVAGALALGFSLCLIVVLTLLSTRASIAMPLPG